MRGGSKLPNAKKASHVNNGQEEPQAPRLTLPSRVEVHVLLTLQL